VQRRDHFGRILQAADVIEHDLGLGLGAWRQHHLPRSLGSSLDPAQDLVRVADGRRQADALHVCAAEARETFQHGREVRAAVLARKSMNFVDDHGA
jgi:hypothetical protein